MEREMDNILVLLSVAVCASARTCASCPQTVGGKSLASKCSSDIGAYTICLYAWPTHCEYYNDGVLYPQQSSASCPDDVGKTTSCDISC